jgi:hypothetical protein
MILFPVRLCPQLTPSPFSPYMYVVELWVHESLPFNYKLLFYTSFPTLCEKYKWLSVCVCARKSALVCVNSQANPLPPSQTVWSTRQIFIDRLCDRLFAQKWPLLFGFHFLSWIIQHGGHVSFWVGHDDKRHVCSVLDVCGGRNLKNILLTLRWCLFCKGW